MSITLNTIKEALQFVDGFNGYGMVSEDEDLQIEKLLNYNLVDDYTAEKRIEYIKYLRHIKEWQEIESEFLADRNIQTLGELDYFRLKTLAESYGY